MVDGETGFVVTRDQERGALAAALAERAAALLDDPALRARMGAAGARRVRDRLHGGADGGADLGPTSAAWRPEAGTCGHDGEVSMLRGKDIVCVSSLDWDAMWTSKQQIMHRLAQTNRVLYVEEPVTMLAPLKVPAHWRRWGAALPRCAGRCRSVDAHPSAAAALRQHEPGGQPREPGVLARYIRWAMDRLYFDEEYIFWTYLPTSVALLDHLGRGRWAGRRPRRHRPAPAGRRPCADGLPLRRRALGLPRLRRPRRWSGPTTTSSPGGPTWSSPPPRTCAARASSLNPHTYTVLNAADVEIFGRALDPDLPLPADSRPSRSPRIGVVGMHDSRLDVEALEALARPIPPGRSCWSGRCKPGQVDEARLRRLPNVHLLGEKPRPSCPAYLKGLDVALIPYKPNELTRNIFPLKLFEYLAGGRAGGGGRPARTGPFAGIIGIAGGPEDYPGLVREADRRGRPREAGGPGRPGRPRTPGTTGWRRSRAWSKRPWPFGQTEMVRSRR